MGIVPHLFFQGQKLKIVHQKISAGLSPDFLKTDTLKGCSLELYVALLGA